MLGLMRKKTHMRKYIELGEAYRADIETAQRNARLVKDELDRLTRSLVPGVWLDRDLMNPDLVKMVVMINASMANRLPHTDMLRMLDDAFRSRVQDLVFPSRDSRGDMRQTEAQRLFGVS